MSSNKRITRRDFIRETSAAALASSVAVGGVGIGAGCKRLQPAPDQPAAESAGAKPASAPGGEVTTPETTKTRARVVLVRDPEVLGAGRMVKAEVLTRMLDQAVGALLQAEPAAAWRSLLRADDVLGIKTNVWRFLRTPPELEATLVERAQQVGIERERIAIDDRGIRSNPVFQNASALINVRPMRTHHWSGVGSCIKNYIMFSPVPFSWHADSCANLGGVWELPEVKGKTRLNILVMLTPLFHGKGPHHYQADYTWEYNGLIVGQDPVAVDATGVRILEAKRREHFGQDEPLSVSPKHIWVAEERYQLGVADPARIDVVKLGSTEGILI